MSQYFRSVRAVSRRGVYPKLKFAPPSDTILSENLGPSAGSFAAGTLSFAARPTFDSFISYRQLQATRGWIDPMPPTCIIVEDYRSSTAFDALGSIGGLFAIVQGLHILLFGRPLFWGLLGKYSWRIVCIDPASERSFGYFVGAKLISPFGLLGGLSSRQFRRRLKKHYTFHEQPMQSHGTARSTLRIDAFLRDFVIDFGPVDFEPEKDIEKGEENSVDIS